MRKPVILASVFSDQMNAIERASTQEKLIDAVIILAIAGGLNVVADRTNLPVIKWACWATSAVGAYVIYLALFA